ncbi:hypothetical protein [Gardnerella sp. DNF00536]|uniref:hypothetical protein n=1 Tax=Gardnerella sp. DNF00536 TaxID=2749050 RepID=UPI003BAF0C39
MLSKKAIAAFAAGATLVSGLALTVPALADNNQQPAGDSTQVDNSVKELGEVSFKFVNGGDSVTSRTFKTVYCKDGKYGFDKAAISYDAASIVYSVFSEAKVNNNKFANVKGIAFPTTIHAGVNEVQVSDNAASNKEEQTPEALQKQAEHQLETATSLENITADGITAAFKGLTYEQAKALYEKIANEVNATKMTSADGKVSAADAAKLKAAQDAFNAIAKAEAKKVPAEPSKEQKDHDAKIHEIDEKGNLTHVLEDLAKKAEQEGLKDAAVKIRAAKTVEEANELLTTAEAVKADIEALAKKAESEGFILTAKKIRAAKTVKAAQDLLVKAEKAAIKALAKKAEKELLHEAAQQIRAAKTVEQARTILTKAENTLKNIPAPVVDKPVDDVTVAPEKEEEPTNPMFVTEDPDELAERLELESNPSFYKTEDPDVMVKRILKQDAIEKIAKQAEKEGFNFAAKQIRKAKTVEGAQALLDAARASKKTPEPKPVPPTPETKFDIEHALSQVNGDTVADYKLHPADVSELVGGKGQTPVVPTPAVDPAIEALAKKAESEGLTFAAKYIRKAKTVEGARALLAEAEKSAIEDLAKKAEKEGFTFVAKLIRKAKTVEGARALLAEAEKGKKPTPTPVPPTPKPTPTPTPTPVPPAPKPTPTPTPTPVPPAPKPTPTPTPTPVPPAPVPTPEPKIEHKLDLVDLLGGKDAKEPTFVSPDGSENLFTNYDGLTVLLAKHGLTNVAAYDALLDKLEFGLKQTGWANILKNFGGDNCAYLGKLRNQLKKAVAHYGHVEAAVKDILAELNADYKDAQKAEDWDAAKVIKTKLATASKLAEVAHHNLTRAAAILDSANDHAKDLSCDTGAQEVLDAMKKAGNFPGKAAAKAPAKKHAAAAAAPLAKTGAAVALAAVAASVLAGMGAALRKIRH